MATIFRTLKKHNVLIVKHPFIYTEKYKAGANKGKMKSKRQVQYVEHLDSIYVDEQKKIEPNPIPTPVYIKKMVISVEDDNPQLAEMLRLHPDNKANGGHIWKEVDVESEELYEIQKFEALDEARRHIMKADENTLRAAAVFFMNPNYINKTPSTIKIKLREVAEMSTTKQENPTEFVDKLNTFFNSDSNEEKLTTTLAINESIIKIMGGKKVVWADSEETIYIAGQPKDTIPDFAVWLKTDKEGRQTLSTILSKLEKLKNDKIKS